MGANEELVKGEEECDLIIYIYPCIYKCQESVAGVGKPAVAGSATRLNWQQQGCQRMNVIMVNINIRVLKQDDVDAVCHSERS